MGRSKFIPPMMRLTKLLFRWTLVVTTTVTFVTSYAADGPVGLALLSLAAATINAVASSLGTRHRSEGSPDNRAATRAIAKTTRRYCGC
jgi:hypothetical protein